MHLANRGAGGFSVLLSSGSPTVSRVQRVRVMASRVQQVLITRSSNSNAVADSDAGVVIHCGRVGCAGDFEPNAEVLQWRSICKLHRIQTGGDCGDAKSRRRVDYRALEVRTQ